MNKQKYLNEIRMYELAWNLVQKWREKYKNDYYEEKMPTANIAIKTIGYVYLGYGKCRQLFWSDGYKKFVRDFKGNTRFAYARIEDFDIACSEDFRGWVIHHRKETDKKPISATSLMKRNLYFNRPAEELIFLRKNEHLKLHLTNN